MPIQGVLTVVTEVLPGRAEALVAVLDKLSASLHGDSTEAPIADFRKLDTVHFARFAVLPKAPDGKEHLVFSTAHDGPRALHLTELVKRIRPGLCTVYEHCVGFPPAAPTSPAALVTYLEQSSVRYGAMHVGYVGRALSDIREEEALRRFIQRRLDEERSDEWAERPARAIRADIVRWVRESEHRGLLEPRDGRIAPSNVEGWWKNPAVVALGLSAVGAGGMAAFAVAPLFGMGYLVVLAGAAGAIVLALRHYETTEPAKTDTDVARGLEHATDEDFGIRNQLTHIADVKPSAFRRTLLRVVLFAVEIRARLQFYKGDLGGIETIHCAHWAVIDGDPPRLLFISNYDGSWERYLGDFIEEAGSGMTAVWSNTVNYPRARFLLREGATNERVFKAWTREKQVRTQVWYAALPDISIRNVNDNSRLRDGLRGGMSEEEARKWLLLL